MKIVTWNVNGIRPRLERLLAWTEEHAPDVLCLQETKVEDDAFPRAAFEERGFHVAAYGQKTYNGVAIISRETPTELMYGFPDDGPDADRRLLAGTFGMLRLYCAYVPNGQTPESDQFATKLDWLRRLHDHVDATCGRRTRILLAGDFNIAPEARDVYDPERYRGQVHFHPDEHEALARLAEWGFMDLFRKHHPEGGLYSWWDYRAGAFQRNHGLRIDLLLGTQPLWRHCAACAIDRDERARERPSDHVPVVAVFD